MVREVRSDLFGSDLNLGFVIGGLDPHRGLFEGSSRIKSLNNSGSIPNPLSVNSRGSRKSKWSATMESEVGTKLVRILYFVGAGVICTKGINFWRDYERKQAIAAASTAESPQTPAELVNGAAAKS